VDESILVRSLKMAKDAPPKQIVRIRIKPDVVPIVANAAKPAGIGVSRQVDPNLRRSAWNVLHKWELAQYRKKQYLAGRLPHKRYHSGNNLVPVQNRDKARGIAFPRPGANIFFSHLYSL
jgi:hypothetical protein